MGLLLLGFSHGNSPIAPGPDVHLQVHRPWGCSNPQSHPRDAPVPELCRFSQRRPGKNPTRAFSHGVSPCELASQNMIQTIRTSVPCPSQAWLRALQWKLLYKGFSSGIIWIKISVGACNYPTCVWNQGEPVRGGSVTGDYFHSI